MTSRLDALRPPANHGAEWSRGGVADPVADADIRIGSSGWQYEHWRGAFYRADLPQHRWLDYYAQQFDTVEINNTFYRPPDASAFAAWKRAVPRGFLYAVKASRFLTIDRLFSRARHLGHTFGPTLYQLPPRWHLDLDRLAIFARALPARRRLAIEFRDPSWYTDDVFALLARHRIALCLHDMAGSATGQLAIGPFVYVRFHGPQKYTGRYGDRTLEGWADWLAGQRREGKRIYAYFNNDIGAHAPRDAVRLRALLTATRGPATRN